MPYNRTHGSARLCDDIIVEGRRAARTGFRLLAHGALREEMSIDSRHVGREGEKLFELLCTRSGVSCNKSVEDAFGWDFHIEFRPAAKPQLPIDERPTGQAALAQV